MQTPSTPPLRIYPAPMRDKLEQEITRAIMRHERGVMPAWLCKAVMK